MNQDYNSSGFPPYQQPSNFQPPKTNGKSIAALVLGILGIVIPYIGLILGIIAIVIARSSLNEIKRTGEQGRGMSIAGLVCGIVGTALYSLIFLFLIVVAIIAFGSSA